MVRGYSATELIERCKSLPSFTHFPNEYWILGVRSREDIADHFDDKFYLFHGEKFAGVVTTGTTNPGAVYLKGKFKEYNQDGAFILESDKWHYQMWRPGLHRGKMKALVQASPVTGYRDGNMNDKSEEIGKYVRGMFGINFHANTYNKFNTVISWVIGLWSAGCQVPNNRPLYNKIIEKTENQDFVSYCLLKEF